MRMWGETKGRGKFLFTWLTGQFTNRIYIWGTPIRWLGRLLVNQPIIVQLRSSVLCVLVILPYISRCGYPRKKWCENVQRDVPSVKTAVPFGVSQNPNSAQRLAYAGKRRRPSPLSSVFIKKTDWENRRVLFRSRFVLCVKDVRCGRPMILPKSVQKGRVKATLASLAPLSKRLCTTGRNSRWGWGSNKVSLTKYVSGSTTATLPRSCKSWR